MCSVPVSTNITAEELPVRNEWLKNLQWFQWCYCFVLCVGISNSRSGQVIRALIFVEVTNVLIVGAGGLALWTLLMAKKFMEENRDKVRIIVADSNVSLSCITLHSYHRSLAIASLFIPSLQTCSLYLVCSYMRLWGQINYSAFLSILPTLYGVLLFMFLSVPSNAAKCSRQSKQTISNHMIMSVLII